MSANQRCYHSAPSRHLQGVFGDFFKNSQLIQNLLRPLASAFPPERVLHTVLVKNVSKARFATLFGSYSAGDYKKLPQGIIRVSTAKVVRIEALEGDLTTCLDGESMHSQCVTLKLADKKVNFFAPKGCDPDATAR